MIWATIFIVGFALFWRAGVETKPLLRELTTPTSRVATTVGSRQEPKAQRGFTSQKKRDNLSEISAGHQILGCPKGSTLAFWLGRARH
jgi:hypothetical protein